MSALPQHAGDLVHVIVHGKRKHRDSEGREHPLYLGQFGWTIRAFDALQFDSAGFARAGLDDRKRLTPLLFAGHDAGVVTIERPVSIAGTLSHDYDPFEAH